MLSWEVGVQMWKVIYNKPRNLGFTRQEMEQGPTLEKNDIK